MSGINVPPVLIVGFNRPEYTQQVFDVVRQAKPKQLFLALDAPRDNRPDDIPGYETCKKIFDSVDWDCEVKCNYATENMGCRDRMVSAITWLFDNVEQGIIFEDDVVPDITFFRYCGELLEKYKTDTRIGMIAGHDEHLHPECVPTYGDSYYFDRMATISGWATWRRAWKLFQPDMGFWPELSKRFELFDVIFRSKAYTRRRARYSWQLYRREAGAWAGIWMNTLYKENMLCIHPARNLISHIGVKSVRAGLRDSPYDNRKRFAMQFPLKHPIAMIPNEVSEHYYLRDICCFDFTLRQKIGRVAYRIFAKLARELKHLKEKVVTR